MLDKKIINDRRLALIAHVSECDICKEWRMATIEESPEWFGRMGGPRPRMKSCLSKHRRHLEEVGMLIGEEAVWISQQLGN